MTISKEQIDMILGLKNVVDIVELMKRNPSNTVWSSTKTDNQNQQD